MDDEKIKLLGKEVVITHPEKLIFPESGIKKIDLARYYAKLPRWAFSQMLDRPLVLVRCPSGYKSACFFQKHPQESGYEGLSKIRVKESSGWEYYIAAVHPSHIVRLIQMNVLEIHTWQCRRQDLEHPDKIVFDLDPDPSVSSDRVIEAALLLKKIFTSYKMKSFVQTTGGKGLHVVIPLTGTDDWEDVKEFTRLIATTLESQAPQNFTATMSKAKRKGKIFIDYFRNYRGASSIAPYSVRARKGAPVATPLDWKELRKGMKFDNWNVKNFHLRMKKVKKDPWAAFMKTKQSIPKIS